MSTPRGSNPDPMPQRSGSDPAVEALLEYLATTAVTPPADLTARIHARIALEPDRTPPRRYVLALLHVRLRTAAGAFWQLVRVSGGQGHFPALLRAQALGLVLVTVLAAAALGAGAAVGVTRLLQDRRATNPTLPTRTNLPGPTGTPMPSRSVDPTSPTPTPSDTNRLVHPTPRLADPTRVPASPTPPPTKVPRSQRVGGSGRTPAPADATPRPAKSPKAGHPDPTRTPQPDPTPTKTPKPDKTPRPTHRPERTERPEPTDTPEPGDGNGDGDGNGPAESEAPHDHSGKGSVWSGDVWMGALVPPAPSTVAEGTA